MISTHRLCVAAGLLVIFAATATAQVPSGQSRQPSAAEKAVQARLTAIQAAAETLDPDRVFSFVLENDKGALVQNGKLFLTREAALESTKQAFGGLEKVAHRSFPPAD